MMLFVIDHEISAYLCQQSKQRKHEEEHKCYPGLNLHYSEHSW